MSNLCSKRQQRYISTAHSQQCDILEERQQEHENIRGKMIKDLINFIHSLSACSREIVICIDTHEEFIPGKSDTAKLVKFIDLIYPPYQ